ncbi:MAG: VWA domain-containing protein [Polyangiaceae bacterium]|nr:VWA domain-containing protein [Polyangiaceae bacterium]
MRTPFYRRPGLWLAAAALAAAVPALWMTAQRGGLSEQKPVVLVSQAPHAAEPGRYDVPAATAMATMGSKPIGAGLAAPMKQHAGDGLRSETAYPGNKFDSFSENPFQNPTKEPLSTFSIDVDTASYALVRSFLTRGEMPPAGSVRIEEMVNYFSYAYTEPTGDVPFAVHLDAAATPWATTHKLVRVALKGKNVQLSRMDGVNLVFLVDTSGSMSDPNKLPLLKQGFRMMVDSLNPTDRVAIVAYAGSAGLVLPSTPVSQKSTILGALDRLESGGSTNGGAGINLAYSVASEHFFKGGVNRVILATDGDFNVGATSNEALVDLIQEKAKTGVFLSVLGFGMGNYNDSLLEKIADKGNGQYSYIDSEVEAKRALVDGLGGLVTIAKDVKIQIEWNPQLVSGYRLIGYENRTMAAEDFNNDKKDAGELGAGHTVTALYEITQNPTAGPAAGPNGGLKYQPSSEPAPATGELCTVKLRYKDPAGTDSKLIEKVLVDKPNQEMSADFKFAAAVASFGMLLRKSPHAGSATYQSVLDLAEPGAGNDPRRRELVDLVKKMAQARRE